MGVLLAAIASGTLQHPKAVATTAHPDSEAEEEAWASDDTEREVAGKWRWLSTTILIGTCGRLTEAPSEDEITVDWEVCGSALTGASGCILAALACLKSRQSGTLEDALDGVLDDFCKLGDELLQKWPTVSAWNPVVQHLRMVGAWLLALGRQQWAERIARIVAKTEPPRDSIWDGGDYWSRRYPTDLGGGRWQPPIISVTGQRAVPHYWGAHEFTADPHRQRFEELVEQVAGAAGRGRTDDMV